MCGASVLIVEDDAAVGEAMASCLRQDGHRVSIAANGAHGLARAREGVDVILLDDHLPDTDGFEMLRRLRSAHSCTPVIMFTQRASIDHAVEAMKRGAFHYLPMPAELDEVSRTVRRAAVLAQARGAHDVTAQEEDPTRCILGQAPAVAQLRRTIRRIASCSNATVLITGESGTGKDLAARALHATSPRRDRPFTTVTCTALPGNLLESELFGHERGAFTDAKSRHRGLFERSEGGTLFLDEIGDMDLTLQAKLLHVLEHKRFRRVGGSEDLSVDVRVVAATNIDLPSAIAQGRFRADLYYRLAVLVLHMPPLRERRSDIELLSHRFAARFSDEADGLPHHLTEEALHRLVAHDWPGNVRELRNVIERAVILAEGRTIDVDDIQLTGPGAHGPPPFELPAEGVDIRAVEKALVTQALERTGGNVTRAARLLGMNRDQVRYRVQKFGLREVGLELERSAVDAAE